MVESKAFGGLACTGYWVTCTGARGNAHGVFGDASRHEGGNGDACLFWAMKNSDALDGDRVAFNDEIMGMGSPVVFFPGAGWSGRAGLIIAEALQESYQVALADLPGYGRNQGGLTVS